LEVEPKMKVAHFEVIYYHTKFEYFWTSGWLGVVFLSLESFGYWKNLRVIEKVQVGQPAWNSVGPSQN
jgi:hypothetical protein